MNSNEVKEFLDLVRKTKHKINLPHSIELFLLLEIKFDKKITASMIANKYHVTIPAVMHKLDDLVANDYLVKTTCDKDKRKKYYSLTAKANLYLEENRQIIDYKIDNLFNYLGNDKDELIRILKRICEMEDDINV